MTEERAKRGRPSKFDPAFCERARLMCERGALDVDLARAFHVSLSTLYLWRNEFPEFSEATTRGKAIADAAVEAALFRRATGYSHDSVKIFLNGGQPVEVPYVEHLPPDTQAAIFWLKNRRPDKWRDKTELQQHGHLEVRWLSSTDVTVANLS